MTTIGSSAAATSASVRAGITGAGRRDPRGMMFQVLLLGSLLFSLAVLFVLIADVLGRAVPVFADRGLGFLTSPLSSNPAKAGHRPGPRRHGRSWPPSWRCSPSRSGLATAIYLEEYAADTRLTRFIQINIRNLAGVPSVVYGLLGPVGLRRLHEHRGLATGPDATSWPAASTLAVLVLPIVIITSIEALRAVPEHHPRGRLRRRRLALGGDAPARAAVGRARDPDRHRARALAGARRDRAAHPGRRGPRHRSPALSPSSTLFTGSYTALPVIVYDWARKPQDGLPGRRRRGDRRPARDHAVRQRDRHPPPQPLRADLVMPDTTGDPMTAATASDPASSIARPHPDRPCPIHVEPRGGAMPRRPRPRGEPTSSASRTSSFYYAQVPRGEGHLHRVRAAARSPPSSGRPAAASPRCCAPSTA